MVLERLIGHSFDHIRPLREEFIPLAIRIHLSEKHCSNRFLLFFWKFFRCRIGFVKQIRHGMEF